MPVSAIRASACSRATARDWSAAGRFDALVSTDGDGDRPLVAHEQGEWLRGDMAGITRVSMRVPARPDPTVAALEVDHAVTPVPRAAPARPRPHSPSVAAAGKSRTPAAEPAGPPAADPDPVLGGDFHEVDLRGRIGHEFVDQRPAQAQARALDWIL